VTHQRAGLGMMMHEPAHHRELLSHIGAGHRELDEIEASRLGQSLRAEQLAVRIAEDRRVEPRRAAERDIAGALGRVSVAEARRAGLRRATGRAMAAAPEPVEQASQAERGKPPAVIGIDRDDEDIDDTDDAGEDAEIGEREAAPQSIGQIRLVRFDPARHDLDGLPLHRALKTGNR